MIDTSTTAEGRIAVASRLDAHLYREVMSRYPTGVVVVTANGEDEPVGMTIGTFSSVSLEPRLIAFAPSKTSRAWRALHAAGPHFAANVLSSRQLDVCQAVTGRTVNKLGGVAWYPSPAGNPFIEGAVLSIDCTVEHLYEAGDHYIVVARAGRASIADEQAQPLIFLGGEFGSFAPTLGDGRQKSPEASSG